MTTPTTTLATTARLSLGETAPTLSTQHHLNFQLDHAQARDAVHAALDIPQLQRGLTARNLTSLTLHSAAATRREYLRRPDLGRKLSASSRELLQQQPPTEVAIVLADGLSALAVERHALPLLDALLPLFPVPYSLFPALNARVALGDEVGGLLQAKLSLVLIGERPGLSSPDSLGAYITWQPRVGRTDAERNCISNIRREGLSYAEAAYRIAHYFAEAQRLGTTGIALKDPPAMPLLTSEKQTRSQPRTQSGTEETP